jgi:hypothetical protein
MFWPQSIRTAIGHTMVAAPFVALFIFISIDRGVLTAIGIFAGTALVIAWLYVAAVLLS